MISIVGDLINNQVRLRRLIQDLPKLLLHTHLEGSIPSETLAFLCRRNLVSLPFEPSDHLAGHLRLNGWSAFAEVIRAVFTCFRAAADFSDAVVGYAKSLSSQNVVYAEFHCSPWKHIKRGISLRSIETGLLDGIASAMRHHGVEMKLICDIVRDSDEDRGLLLDWVSTLPRSVCPAIGISGGFRSVPLAELREFCD
jgi:adenosine deaminase